MRSLVLWTLLALAAQGERALSPDELWAAGRRAEAVAAQESAITAAAKSVEAGGPDIAGGREAALVQLALWERELARYDAALHHLETLGDLYEPLRGELYYKSHRYDQALPRLSRTNPQQSVWLVDTLEALERFDEAAAALESAAALRGANDARVQCMRGRQLARDGRYAEAIPCFEVAHAADAIDAEALFGLGQALVRAGDEKRGLELLEQHRRLVPLLDKRQFAMEGLALEPRSAHNHAQLGDVERELQRLDVAEREYLAAEALAESEQLAPITLRLARLYSDDLRDVQRALDALTRAEQRSIDPRLPVRAGDLLAAAGRRDEARAAYKRALAIRPSDAKIRARIEALDAPASRPAGAAR